MNEEEFAQITQAIMTDQTILPVHINIAQAWMLVSALQLATRHSEISAYMRKELEAIARQFQGAIVELHPEAQALLEMGWNEENGQ